MASILTVAASMSVSGLASITSPTISKSLTCVGDSDIMEEIGFAADEEVTLNPDVGTTKALFIANLDTANAVTLSYDTTGAFATFAFMLIPAGAAIYFFPVFPTGKTKIYAQAAVAAVTVLKLQCEA
jgi:hypothetical protein